MVEQEIAKLAGFIRKAVCSRKQADLILTHTQVRVRRGDFSLKYRNDLGITNFAPERISEDIWDWQDQELFHSSVIADSEEYKSLVSALGPKAALVYGFAHAVSFASYRGLDDKELSERIAAFGRQLEGKALPVKVTAFIDGLFIQESPLVISNRFILREPIPEDVAQYTVLDEYGGFSFPIGHTWFTVIGEFICDAMSPGMAQAEFLRTVEALRLFRVGGVSATRYSLHSRQSFLYGPGAVAFAPGRHSRFSYAVTGADTIPIQKFLDDITPVVPDPLQPAKATTEKEIAYARYRDALFHEQPSEYAITSAITALEALFLRGEPELSHRLAQRVSVFLRVLGTQLEGQSTYENVQKGYRIRSKFIHGSPLLFKDRPGADSLAPILLEYARQCTLTFFQISTPKAELLEQLDRVMVEPTTVNAIERSLVAVVHR